MDEWNGDGTDLGGPLPIWRVVHEEGSEIAFLLPFDQASGDLDDGGEWVRAHALAPLGFEVPVEGDWCYAFGYPTLAADRLTISRSGGARLDLTRGLSRAAGRVVEAFPNGQPGHAMVPGAAFQANVPAPFGMSGGPVLTDGNSVCALMSSALDAKEHHPEWS